jgi:COP9 signalosome complex subunit 1
MFHSMIEFIQSKVIDNVNFRNFLELVPEVREFVNDFYSRYVASELSYSLHPHI